MLWFMLSFCGRCFVFSCALVVHQSCFVCGFLRVSPLMLFIAAGSLLFFFHFLFSGLLLYGRFFALLASLWFSVLIVSRLGFGKVG